MKYLINGSYGKKIISLSLPLSLPLLLLPSLPPSLPSFLLLIETRNLIIFIKSGCHIKLPHYYKLLCT